MLRRSRTSQFGPVSSMHCMSYGCTRGCWESPPYMIKGLRWDPGSSIASVVGLLRVFLGGAECLSDRLVRSPLAVPCTWRRPGPRLRIDTTWPRNARPSLVAAVVRGPRRYRNLPAPPILCDPDSLFVKASPACGKGNGRCPITSRVHVLPDSLPWMDTRASGSEDSLSSRVTMSSWLDSLSEAALLKGRCCLLTPQDRRERQPRRF